jgi:hypothetical protein
MSEDVGAALDRLSGQVSDLQAQVRALDRPSALPAEPAPDVAPPGAHTWLDSLEAPARRRPQLPRVLLEGLFLAAAAAAAAIAELEAVAIAGVMVGAWVLVALIEWAASRAEREPAIPVYTPALPETRPADPAWFAPPVEHTLLEGAGGDPVTAVTRLPPVLAESGAGRTQAADDLDSTSPGGETAPPEDEDSEATVEQRRAF